MNWLNEWAKWQVISFWVGIGLVAFAILCYGIYWAVIGISYFYKSHSKKYEWNCLINEYEKKENTNEKRRL